MKSLETKIIQSGQSDLGKSIVFSALFGEQPDKYCQQFIDFVVREGIRKEVLIDKIQNSDYADDGVIYDGMNCTLCYHDKRKDTYHYLTWDAEDFELFIGDQEASKRPLNHFDSFGSVTVSAKDIAKENWERYIKDFMINNLHKCYLML